MTRFEVHSLHIPINMIYAPVPYDDSRTSSAAIKKQCSMTSKRLITRLYAQSMQQYIVATEKSRKTPVKNISCMKSLGYGSKLGLLS